MAQVAVYLGLALVTSLLYGSTINDGLHYDDWHLFRPWSWSELSSVWSGSWDPTGTEGYYFRPLTAWWFAGAYWLLGLNGVGLHAISLLLHALCAVLLYHFIRREGAPFWVAYFGGALYVVHPTLVYAQTAWLTNQMHGLASVLVLLSLLTWQSVRPKALWGWWPLLPLAAVAFLIKEDTVVLLPALVALTGLRRLFGADQGESRYLSLVVLCMLFTVGLITIRGQLLDVTLPWPTFQTASDHYVKGLTSVLRIYPPRRPWQDLASFLATMMLAVVLPVLVLRLRRKAEALRLALSGLTIVLVFNAPFIFVSKVEQYHILALGGTLLLAGCVYGMWTSIPWRVFRGGVVITACALLVSFFGLSWNVVGDFEPCHPIRLYADDIVQGWGSAPSDIRTWLEAKVKTCKAGGTIEPITKSPFIAWGVTAQEWDGDTPFRWTDEHATFMASVESSSLMLAFRHPAADGDTPAWVRFQSQGTTREFILRAPNWEYVTIPLQPSLLSRLRGMVRIDLDVQSDWVPELAHPWNQKPRRFGIQIHHVTLQR